MVSVFFVCGKFGYKIILPDRNIVALFFKCVGVCSSGNAAIHFKFCKSLFLRQ